MMSRTFRRDCILNADYPSRPIASATSSSPGCTLKRKRKFSSKDNSRRQVTQSKSKGISQFKRYLIGCAYLIYIREDKRSRDFQGNLIPVASPPKKMYGLPSELPQLDMVALYFGNIHRTIVSQSKSKKYVFAAPDWILMHPYLFPWIHVNTRNAQFHPTRKHIKHIAFRIWEYLVFDSRVVIKHDDGIGQPHNLPLGDVRGWWCDTDGKYPPGYMEWLESYDGTVPEDYREIILKVMSKRWPLNVISSGLLVDADTPAPHVETVDHKTVDGSMPTDVNERFSLPTTGAGEAPKLQSRSCPSGRESYHGYFHSSSNINTSSPSVSTLTSVHITTYDSLENAKDSPVCSTEENVVGRSNFDPASPFHNYWPIRYRQSQIINGLVSPTNLMGSGTIDPRLTLINANAQDPEIVVQEHVPSPDRYSIPSYFLYEEIAVQLVPCEELPYDDYLVSPWSVRTQ